MQTSQSASNMYQQIVKNITDIVNNPDLSGEKDPETGISPKDAAIKLQQDMLDQSLGAFKAIGQTGVASTVNFNPPVTTSSPATTTAIKNDISQLYRDILGRAPDASGLAYWQRAVDSGQMSVQQVRDALYASDEFKQIVSQ